MPLLATNKSMKHSGGVALESQQWKMEIYPVRFGEIRGVREFFSPPCNKPGG